MKLWTAGFTLTVPLAILIVGAGESGKSATPAAERKMAPAFRLADASGRMVTLADYRGKVVALNFWATECGGCRQEIPAFIQMEDALQSQGLAVVGVSLDIMYENLRNAGEAWGRVRPFVQEHRINYPILMGDDAVPRVYNIESMPATLLIDKKGRVAASWIGVVIRKSEVEPEIRMLLRE
ncbi:MAG TPA: redoxin domain-containing protein [Bryobacteraceae bacterium]|nr:redoxin domain-containing protein [Bryobacteraceae bacterium]